MTFGNATCVDAVAGVVCYGVFFNYHGPGDNHPAVEDCSAPENFDPDITGIGVVISFCASAIICQIASVTASVLDNIASRRTSILPTRWQPQNISDRLRARCTFYRRILEKLILNLADQQLVTGFALIIGAWVGISMLTCLETDQPFLGKHMLTYRRSNFIPIRCCVVSGKKSLRVNTRIYPTFGLRMHNSR